jgi:hypothetical protein
MSQLTEHRPGTPVVAGKLLFGRGETVATILRSIEDGSAVRVVFIHGIAGIGKSTLLAACVDEARASHTVVTLDGRSVEPTEAGFVDALGRAVGLPGADLETLLAQLADRAPAVIALDTFENLRLIDSWLRRTFVPALTPEVRFVVAGREPPVAVWLTAPGLEGGIRSVALGPLPEGDAAQLLVALGVSPDRAKQLNRIARGHPLALRLAAATLADQPERLLDQVAAHEVTDQLARLYLADVPDPDTRTALEAACVVRRVTRSVLGAMAPGAPAERFGLLADLPFVQSQADGLLVHDSVREAIARYLHAVDPSTYRRYRWLAWRRLATEVRAVPPDELWRYTADMLYLIENPVVREAFFPSGAQPLAVEPAPANAFGVLETMTSRHDGSEAVEIVRRWWTRAPDSFSIIRDRDGLITGYSHILNSRQLRESAPVGDPVVDTWREHLQHAPVPRGQLVLGFRRWLDMEIGEAPGATQAATWLDVKRTYMALRPQLRRIYVAVCEAETYWPIVERLGFRLLPESLRTAAIGGATYTSVVLDFGPQSVDGWLAGLVAAELGVGTWELDADAHELRADGRRIGLTPLEFAVLDNLRRIPGRTVSRRELLHDVWGWDGTATSNVVDATVRRLRHKLEYGPIMVETVRGAGYRLHDR